MEDPRYFLKGLTPGGYALERIEEKFKRSEAISKEDLIANDTHAVTFTFETILKEIKNLKNVIITEDLYFIKIYNDLSNKMSLEDCMKKWAFILDKDFEFKNRLCD